MILVVLALTRPLGTAGTVRARRISADAVQPAVAMSAQIAIVGVAIEQGAPAAHPAHATHGLKVARGLVPARAGSGW